MTLELGLGANGVTDDDYVQGSGFDLDPLVGLHVAGLYRFLPFLSAGVVLHYGFIYPDTDYDESFSGFAAMVGAIRGHYAFGRFEPWGELGMGYASAHSWARGEWNVLWWSGDAEGSMSLHGVGFDLAFGVNIYLTDSFSLSPFFRMILAAWPTACYWIEAGADDDDRCDEPDEIYGNEPDDYPHLWVVGVSAANTF